MKAAAITRMSSKGQIVIPESIREHLGLKPGMEFYVVGDDDVIVLKMLAYPELNDFKELIAQARDQASTAGLKPSDIDKAVKKVRSGT